MCTTFFQKASTLTTPWQMASLPCANESEVRLNGASFEAVSTTERHYQENGVAAYERAQRKRPYRYITRQKGSRSRRSQKKSRFEALSKNFERLHADLECCKNRCFSKMDIVYLRAQASRILPMGELERKSCLASFLHRGNYYFNHVRVCSRFLVVSFRFSKCLQATVKGTKNAKGTPELNRLSKEIRTYTLKD